MLLLDFFEHLAFRFVVVYITRGVKNGSLSLHSLKH